MIIERVISRGTPAFAVDSVELLGLVDEGEPLQLLQPNRHRTRTTPGRARNRIRSFHPRLPPAAHLLAVDDQLRLADQHLPHHLQAEVGGGLKQPTLDSMAHLQLQVAFRWDESGVEGDDASVSALAHHHPALAKEPQSETSRADDDGVSPLVRRSKKVETRVDPEISEVKEKDGAATACTSLLLTWASTSPSPLLIFLVQIIFSWVTRFCISR